MLWVLWSKTFNKKREREREREKESENSGIARKRHSENLYCNK
jgi:hypothetical protein